MLHLKNNSNYDRKMANSILLKSRDLAYGMNLILRDCRVSKKYFELGLKQNSNNINLLCNYGNLKRELNDIDGSILLYKKAYKITKEIFNKQYKKKIKMRFRKHLSENDLVFPLLVNFVSTELTITTFKFFDETKLTKIFLNLNATKKGRLNNIIENNYNFICINDINYNKELLYIYYTFSQRFREKLSNIKNANYIAIKLYCCD